MSIPIQHMPGTGRWQFRDDPLRRRIAVIVCLFGIGSLAYASLLAEVLGAGWTFIAGTLLAYAVVAVATLWDIEGHRGHRAFGPANTITLARAALASAIGGVLLATGTPDPIMVWTVFALTAIAFMLDAADGWIARRTGFASDYGARFDQTIDTLILIGLSALVFALGKAGWWILLAGLFRPGFLFMGAMFAWARRPLEFSHRRRIVCGVQIGGLLVCAAPIIPAAATWFVAAATLTLLIYSFAADILWLWRRRPALASDAPHTAGERRV